jgi:hypothetical protein
MTQLRSGTSIDGFEGQSLRTDWLIAIDKRKLKAAERQFRAALEGGERQLEHDGDEVPWGIVENPPRCWFVDYSRGRSERSIRLGRMSALLRDFPSTTRGSDSGDAHPTVIPSSAMF